MLCWDNYDYNQGVRHQTLSEQSTHVSATTGKICIANELPPGGLRANMLRPQVLLKRRDVLLAPGNEEDLLMSQIQRHWIVEAIKYAHTEAVQHILSDKKEVNEWFEFPTVSRLPAKKKTEHYNFDPILENEGTISGTYNVIERLFSDQLGFKPTNESDLLYLVYGDQKTVSLIHTVQKERSEAINSYDRYNWLLAIPGLFHWRINLMEMIYEVYSGLGKEGDYSALNKQKDYLNHIIGSRSPFQHKEELAMRSFDARVTAAYYSLLPTNVTGSHQEEVDTYIKGSGPEAFLRHVEQIRESLFSIDAQLDPPEDPAEDPAATENFDFEFSNHAKFLQQMELYKTLKLAIKRADIGLFEEYLPSAPCYSMAAKSIIMRSCRAT